MVDFLIASPGSRVLVTADQESASYATAGREGVLTVRHEGSSDQDARFDPKHDRLLLDGSELSVEDPKIQSFFKNFGINTSLFLRTPLLRLSEYSRLFLEAEWNGENLALSEAGDLSLVPYFGFNSAVRLLEDNARMAGIPFDRTRFRSSLRLSFYGIYKHEFESAERAAERHDGFDLFSRLQSARAIAHDGGFPFDEARANRPTVIQGYCLFLEEECDRLAAEIVTPQSNLYDLHHRLSHLRDFVGRVNEVHHLTIDFESIYASRKPHFDAVFRPAYDQALANVQQAAENGDIQVVRAQIERARWLAEALRIPLEIGDGLRALLRDVYERHYTAAIAEMRQATEATIQGMRAHGDYSRAIGSFFRGQVEVASSYDEAADLEIGIVLTPPAAEASREAALRIYHEAFVQARNAQLPANFRRRCVTAASSLANMAGQPYLPVQDTYRRFRIPENYR